MLFILLLTVSAKAEDIITRVRKDNKKFLTIRGCTTMSYLIQTTLGEISDYHANEKEKEHTVICDNNTYLADDEFGIVRKITLKAWAADCFKTTINESDKTFSFEYLPENKEITEYYGHMNVFITKNQEPIIFREIKTSDYEIKNLCILDPSKMGFPYNEFDFDNTIKIGFNTINSCDSGNLKSLTEFMPTSLTLKGETEKMSLCDSESLTAPKSVLPSELAKKYPGCLGFDEEHNALNMQLNPLAVCFTPKGNYLCDGADNASRRLPERVVSSPSELPPCTYSFFEDANKPR